MSHHHTYYVTSSYIIILSAGSLLDLIRDREQENERGSGEREALSEPWWP